MWRWVLMTTGVLAVAAGVIGVFVPLLPTTPFLLLAAACFFRSSRRLYIWLVGHRWLGPYLRNYRERHAMTWRAKATALVLLWGAIGYSAVLVASAWWLRLGLGLVALGVTLHLLHLRTVAPGEASGSDRAAAAGMRSAGPRQGQSTSVV